MALEAHNVLSALELMMVIQQCRSCCEHRDTCNNYSRVQRYRYLPIDWKSDGAQIVLLPLPSIPGLEHRQVHAQLSRTDAATISRRIHFAVNIPQDFYDYPYVLWMAEFDSELGTWQQYVNSPREACVVFALRCVSALATVVDRLADSVPVPDYAEIVRLFDEDAAAGMRQVAAATRQAQCVPGARRLLLGEGRNDETAGDQDQ